MINKYFLFGIGISNATENEILEYLVKNLEKSSKKFYIITPNPEILVFANKNSYFKNILNNADLALCDGVGLLWAGKLLGKPFKQRITGTDFMEKVCSEVSKKPITVGFLGGGPQVAERTAKCLMSKYPGLKVAFAGEEWPEKKVLSIKYKVLSIKKKDSTDSKDIHNTKYIIPDAGIDILFVAFGFPKQEEWISKNLSKLPVKAAMGVGGAFDYISGNIPRAPLWTRSIGLEWFYRLIRQPWRLKRQIALLEFVFLVLKEKIRFKN